ncbi:unnamed protein product [Staurois parvus]|uniref:Uncharacterized protein n=1 Tax=Staurois parvus TaxID=386267 RepID=A0ABN9HD67_9NEOB|nr:unnamed protein product [Staurois parvus]
MIPYCLGGPHKLSCCPSVPPNSVHQCRLSMPINAA